MGGCCVSIPAARYLEQRRLGKVVSNELNRQRQSIRGQASHHRQRRMAGDVERRPRLPGICPLGLRGILDAARRVHRAGAQQHIDLAQRIVDRRNHLVSPASGLDVIAGAEERPRK
jgi:hypothetical protein